MRKFLSLMVVCYLLTFTFTLCAADETIPPTEASSVETAVSTIDETTQPTVDAAAPSSYPADTPTAQWPVQNFLTRALRYLSVVLACFIGRFGIVCFAS